ncbi:hypothetical protein KNP414_00969 [Paenibacillus mucilaginosus KNP414]|uniref:Uncharacterized protein n=1 Tax=Paenibacillus mucilaginosus (strain KNP414) TaxID=1036673 RepID=F8FAA6_PAEMK|nr:hypothetical protein KNP414_00969 [Paenibacillus mucilaginosus KNP414]
MMKWILFCSFVPLFVNFHKRVIPIIFNPESFYVRYPPAPPKKFSKLLEDYSWGA